jgi:25S rRNA (adenine2142-N1)-methyltransferase
MEKAGGRAVYQAASQLSVSFFNTSKWVIGKMIELGLRPSKGKPPLKVLEVRRAQGCMHGSPLQPFLSATARRACVQVGAINTTLLDCSWLDVDAIDLRARSSRIIQQDFFALPRGRPYEAIVSSMVLNSVPDAHRRGEMLRRSHEHLRGAGGHMFLMLPLSCLTHSRALTEDGFVNSLERVGFRVVMRHKTPKVAFFVCRAEAEEGGETESALGRPAKRDKRHSRKGPSWAKDFDVVI